VPFSVLSPVDTAHHAFLEHLASPPAEYGAFPFWFWNDDLEEGELLRQLHAFHAAGVGGVVIHPRIGLSERVGYLTPEYFRLVRRVVEECAALGLRVLLYDEGSYPSGSACGRVVAENPEHAARALVLVQKRVSGPWRGYWRPAVGRLLVSRVVSVVLARVEGEVVDAASVQLLTPGERDVVRLDVGEGEWVVAACLDVPSGGTIRGALPHQEDGTATAPPAGDIMNPAAVASFIRLTHAAYAAALGDHLGSTVVGMFTDEPSPLGRGARRNAWPYTAGFDGYLAERLGWTLERTRAWLPALWLDYGPDTQAFRQRYTAAVEERIGDVFYRAQAEWCAAHGIALTGHPGASNDMASLSWFTWPGQDAVWRWVLPPGSEAPPSRDSSAGSASGAVNETGLVGAHSVAAKAATSGARAAGRRRIATELFGAYGWRLSLDEAKWLIDWHLARGNNLFIPHAVFYSVRGGRAFESEPDVALHNCWWPHFQTLLRYVRRMSWLLTDCEHVCEVAVLGTGHALPWAAARVLYERQIDFLYIGDAALAGATVEGGRLHVGTQAYATVVVDESLGRVELGEAARERLEAFEASGGRLIRYALGEAFVEDLQEAVAATGADVRIEPPAPTLRAVHVRKEGVDVYALFNEGEGQIEGRLRVAAPGLVWSVDPLRMGDANLVGEAALGPVDVSAGVPVSLERRECRLLVVEPAGMADGRWAGGEPRVSRTVPVDGPWRVTDADGRVVGVDGLGDWTAIPDDPALERFSGSLLYRTTVTLPGHADPSAPVIVDLGAVGEAAEVRVNGVAAGEALWAPYVVATQGELWRPGENALEVAVTNSAANAYEGAMRPSGLIGPVTLRVLVT